MITKRILSKVDIIISDIPYIKPQLIRNGYATKDTPIKESAKEEDIKNKMVAGDLSLDLLLKYRALLRITSIDYCNRDNSLPIAFFQEEIEFLYPTDEDYHFVDADVEDLDKWIFARSLKEFAKIYRGAGSDSSYYAINDGIEEIGLPNKF